MRENHDESIASPPCTEREDICECCKALFQAVTAELGSYMTAVENTYGCEMAEEAGAWWLDIFDQSSVLNDAPKAELRSITILAASRLASFMRGTVLSDMHVVTGRTKVSRALTDRRYQS
jgi:hypothetical protein